MIKAIVWDVDGVLLNSVDGTGRLYDKHMLNVLGDKHQAYRSALWDGRFEPCLIGQGDTHAVFHDLTQEFQLKMSAEEMMRHWLNAHEDIHHPTINLINTLQNQTHFLGTNQDKYRAHHIWEDLAFKNHFADIFASGLIGHRKPSHDFFAKAQQKLSTSLGDITPEMILFLDDMAENVAAAKNFGWQAEQYTTTDFPTLLTVLKRYGIQTTE